jgi:hypothetical protein
MHSVFPHISQELYVTGDIVTRMKVQHKLVIMKMTHPVHQSQPAILNVNKKTDIKIVLPMSAMREKGLK